MRRAILIRGLIKEEVPAMDAVRYYRQAAFHPAVVALDNTALLTAPVVETVVVPVTKFCRPGRPDTYIAYSDEVEALLGMPFRCILKELDEARAALHRWEYLTPWEHIKSAWRKFWRESGVA